MSQFLCRDCIYYCIHCGICRLYMEESDANDSCSDYTNYDEESEVTHDKETD